MRPNKPHPRLAVTTDSSAKAEALGSDEVKKLLIKGQLNAIPQELAPALKLLQYENFFDQYFKALRLNGLVGEERNAAIILVAGISRLLPKPINVIVKGESSSGKNHLVKSCLRLFPTDSVRELTSSSARAWNYSGDDFRRRIVYLQERNEASGAVHPARLLISEGRLIRTVTVREGNTFVAKTFTAEGPIASISTTTKNQLEIDDETRNLSIWIDASDEQTKRIIQATVKEPISLPEADLTCWREAHQMLEDRSRLPILLPPWYEDVANLVFCGDVRVRRYFQAFTTAVMVMALLRSFQPYRQADVKKNGKIQVDFEDFCIAEIIFERAFAESLHRGTDDCTLTRGVVEKLSKSSQGNPVEASALAKELGISIHKAYANLRNTAACGLIFQANAPEKTNKKLFLPSLQPRFIPSPEHVFRKLPMVGDHARFIHPFTGDLVEIFRKNELIVRR